MILHKYYFNVIWIPHGCMTSNEFISNQTKCYFLWVLLFLYLIHTLHRMNSARILLKIIKFDLHFCLFMWYYMWVIFTFFLLTTTTYDQPQPLFLFLLLLSLSASFLISSSTILFFTSTTIPNQIHSLWRKTESYLESLCDEDEDLT